MQGSSASDQDNVARLRELGFLPRAGDDDARRDDPQLLSAREEEVINGMAPEVIDALIDARKQIGEIRKDEGRFDPAAMII
jgi:hypothetical protein